MKEFNTKNTMADSTDGSTVVSTRVSTDVSTRASTDVSTKASIKKPDTALSLEALIREFESAFARKDWARIAELNHLTQPCVEAASQQLSQQASQSHAPAPQELESAMLQLRPQLEQLSNLYQAIQTSCIAERDALGQQLNQLSTTKQGVSAYQSSAGLSA